MAQTIESAVAKTTDQYLEQFERFEKQAAEPGWLLALRKAGISSFEQQGLPTLRHEDWRFTNLAPLAKRPFKPVYQPDHHGIGISDLERFTFREMEGSRLVFVNGHYRPYLSRRTPEAEKLGIGGLREGLTAHPETIRKHLAQHAVLEDNPFAALNLAFFQDGAFIHVPAGVSLQTAIHLLYISTSRAAGAVTNAA